jgi:hypothetical protein
MSVCLCPYHFLYTPFLFTPTVSETQLGFGVRKYREKKERKKEAKKEISNGGEKDK